MMKKITKTREDDVKKCHQHAEPIIAYKEDMIKADQNGKNQIDAHDEKDANYGSQLLSYSK